jgi:TadE-like protein
VKARESGLTSVEFAFVSTTLMILLFAVVEFGRLLFTYAALGEGTRRAARVAAVCPIGSPIIERAATEFGGLPDFGPRNVQINYLNAFGRDTRFYNNISYVQVRVVDYNIHLSIPLLSPTITAPAFAVTLPRESLGVSPTEFGFCG